MEVQLAPAIPAGPAGVRIIGRSRTPAFGRIESRPGVLRYRQPRQRQEAQLQRRVAGRTDPRDAEYDPPDAAGVRVLLGSLRGGQLPEKQDANLATGNRPITCGTRR